MVTPGYLQNAVYPISSKNKFKSERRGSDIMCGGEIIVLFFTTFLEMHGIHLYEMWIHLTTMQILELYKHFVLLPYVN